MKRWMIILLAAIGMLWLTACEKTEDDILHLGLNAEIIEIDAEDHLLYVKDADGTSKPVFGGRSAIDCQQVIDREKIVYADYDEENDVKIISFGELQVGDQIILGIYESELNRADQEPILAEQLQLSTQRLD